MKTIDTPPPTTIDTANLLHHSIMNFFRVMRVSRSTTTLTLSKLGTLGYLYRNQKATATELAAYLRVKPQSLTRLIADLEHDMFIVRRQNNEDRRQNLLEITNDGIEVFRKDVREQREMLAHIMENELSRAEREVLRIAAGLMDCVSEKIEVQCRTGAE